MLSVRGQAIENPLSVTPQRAFDSQSMTPTISMNELYPLNEHNVRV